MRVRRDFTFRAGDTTETNLVFSRRKQSTDDTTVTEHVSGDRLLDATTNVQINFGGVTTARYIWLEAAGTVLLRPSEAGAPITLGPAITGVPGVFFIEGAAYTQLWVENPAATAVQITYFIGGV